MSWFSLSMQGKDIVDQHSNIMGYCTGSFISKYIFEKAIKDNSLNLILREVAVSHFSSLTASQWESTTKKISQKILDVSLTEKKLMYVTYKLKDQFLLAPGDNFINLSLLAAYAAKKLTKKMLKTGNEVKNPNDSAARQAILEKVIKGKLSEAIHTAVMHSLTPICEEAVQKGLVAATKAAGEKAYDFTLSKACSIIVLPVIYGIALKAFETLGNYYQLPTAACASYLPNASTVLGLSMAGNAVQMTGVIWKESRKSSDKSDMDKEEVKNTIFKFAKKSMVKKISENKLLSYLGVNKTQEDIDKLVNMLVSEALEFYWNDLHETRILGLPLVT